MDVRELEIDWYKKNGLYPDLRIVRDSHDREYVIGDWSWNKKHIDKLETIDQKMRFDLLY